MVGPNVYGALSGIANNPDWTNALPYITTFSRELNGPTWGPTTNATGSSYQYLNIATNTATPPGPNSTCAASEPRNIRIIVAPRGWS